MPFVVKGEGPFADYVRKALEYAQQHGVDLSGVEVEVVPDQSIVGAGAYTEHLGGLRFRVRYNPRYANDPVLAAHEAGHVAKWTWDYKRRGGVQYVPDVDELLAEALGAVVARQLFGVPVTFKGAPLNLTKVLPERFTYITTTVDGKTTAVKVPEWGDYMGRYRAGILVSPYFYNVTNWAHVFGNFTAMPGDVIKTVHEAWKSGAVEVVPGWGAVWRRTPTWTWPDNTANATTQQNPSNDTSSKTDITVANNTQKTDTSTVTVPKVTDTTTTQGNNDQQKTTATILPTGTAPPLSPSTVQSPKYFNEDIIPQYRSMPSEWAKYIDGRRVLLVFRNWEHLNPQDGSVSRKDGVISGGTIVIDKNNPDNAKVVWDRKVPLPAFYDPNAWIEIVDEKTGKVLARLRSDELYKVSIGLEAPTNLFWAHVAAEEKWPGWERFVDRAKELDEKLGTWRPSSVVAPPQTSARGVANVSPDGTVNAVKVANAPTEYVPPKIPDDVRRQFESLLSDLKKLGEGVNLKNVNEVHDRFVQLRDRALDIARAYPQLIDEANSVVGRVGSAIRDASDKLYEALAKAAGRDSFWRGEGDVKTPIGTYKYDPTTGAFLLSVYDGPMAENIVGYIRDDGTPVVVKKTQNMSEALDEYNKLTQKKPQTTGVSPTVQSQPPATQSSQQVDFVLQPLRGAVDFLANALKTGAGVVLTALGGGKPSPAKETSGSEFVQPPSSQQKTDEFVVRPSRAPDYVLAEESIRRSASAGTYSSALDAVAQTSSGYRPVDYVVSQQSSSDRDYTKGRGLWGVSSASSSVSATSSVQMAETPQTTQESESKRYRGRPVAIAI